MHFSFAPKIEYVQYSILQIEPAPRSVVGTSLYRDQAVLRLLDIVVVINNQWGVIREHLVFVNGSVFNGGGEPA